MMEVQCVVLECGIVVFGLLRKQLFGVCVCVCVCVCVWIVELECLKWCVGSVK